MLLLAKAFSEEAGRDFVSGTSLGQQIVDGIVYCLKWLWDCIVSLSFWGCLLFAMVSLIFFFITKVQKHKSRAILSFIVYVLIQCINGVV